MNETNRNHSITVAFRNKDSNSSRTFLMNYACFWAQTNKFAVRFSDFTIKCIQIFIQHYRSTNVEKYHSMFQWRLRFFSLKWKCSLIECHKNKIDCKLQWKTDACYWLRNFNLNCIWKWYTELLKNLHVDCWTHSIMSRNANKNEENIRG